MDFICRESSRMRCPPPILAGCYECSSVGQQNSRENRPWPHAEEYFIIIILPVEQQIWAPGARFSGAFASSRSFLPSFRPTRPPAPWIRKFSRMLLCCCLEKKCAEERWNYLGWNFLISEYILLIGFFFGNSTRAKEIHRLNFLPLLQLNLNSNNNN